MSEEQEFKKQGVISVKAQKWLAEKKRKEEEAKAKPKPTPKKPEPKTNQPTIVKEEHVKYSDGRRKQRSGQRKYQEGKGVSQKRKKRR